MAARDVMATTSKAEAKTNDLTSGTKAKDLTFEVKDLTSEAKDFSSPVWFHLAA